MNMTSTCSLEIIRLYAMLKPLKSSCHISHGISMRSMSSSKTASENGPFCNHPRKRGYCFWFDCMSATLFSDFVRITPYYTQTKPIYYLKAECLECVTGVPFFRTSQNFGVIGLKFHFFGASQVIEFWGHECNIHTI